MRRHRVERSGKPPHDWGRFCLCVEPISWLTTATDQDDRLVNMPKREPNISENAKVRQRALSRWDNEGGAVAVVHQEAPASSVDLAVVPNMTNSELAQLRVRVIALENLLITFLAEATDGQLHRILHG